MHSSLLCFLVALVPLAADAASCSAGYGQCGGQNWSGATCCVDGFTCKATNDYYSQCVPGSSPTTTKPTPTTTQPTTTQPTPTTSSAPSTPTTTTSSPSTPTTTTSSPSTGNYLGYDSTVIAAHDHAAYPSGTCGSMPMDACMSGVWGEKTNVPANDAWHYSRSTHFGLTNGGACGFGLYGLCTKGSKTASWTDPMLGGMCDAFCKAYPVLCQDPTNTTMRGNYAAPNGNYYTQFWPHLKGDKDNYLSCGECFELVRTKPDGTDYQPGEKGYTDPVTLEIIDSCPCSANTKWCCGAAYDQCQEVSNWKYGCPIPKDSTHLDLSDIAMIRLQGNQDMPDGVIPTRYRRVACPKPGNLYIWLRDNGSPYYFALTVVNAGGVGSVSKIEVKGAGTSTWTELMQDPNYPIGHPQERYGSWTIPKGSGPFNTPVAMRITSPNGEQAVVEQAIKSFTPPASAPAGYYYIDLGIQFSAYGKH